MSARPIGLFAALALSPAAWAADPVVQLSYEHQRTDAGWQVKIYAVNSGKTAVMVDDNPAVSQAFIETAAGVSEALVVPNSPELMSRIGPSRTWMTVRPGERLYVGAATIGLTPRTTIEDGTLVLTVHVVTPDGTEAHMDRLPVAKPGV